MQINYVSFGFISQKTFFEEKKILNLNAVFSGPNLSALTLSLKRPVD